MKALIYFFLINECLKGINQHHKKFRLVPLKGSSPTLEPMFQTFWKSKLTFLEFVSLVAPTIVQGSFLDLDGSPPHIMAPVGLVICWQVQGE